MQLSRRPQRSTCQRSTVAALLRCGMAKSTPAGLGDLPKVADIFNGTFEWLAWKSSSCVNQLCCFPFFVGTNQYLGYVFHLQAPIEVWSKDDNSLVLHNKVDEIHLPKGWALIYTCCGATRKKNCCCVMLLYLCFEIFWGHKRNNQTYLGTRDVDLHYLWILLILDEWYMRVMRFLPFPFSMLPVTVHICYLCEAFPIFSITRLRPQNLFHL